MKKQKSYIWILSILSVIGFVGIWWFCCDVLKLTSSSTLPGPVTVIKTFIAKLSSSAPDGATLPQHIGSSLKIALGGWALGVVIGTPLGICMAWYKKVDLFARPIFDLLRPVPGLAWIPLMIILSEDRNGFSFCICSMCLKFLHGNPSDKRCASLGRTDVRRKRYTDAAKYRNSDGFTDDYDGNQGCTGSSVDLHCSSRDACIYQGTWIYDPAGKRNLQTGYHYLWYDRHRCNRGCFFGNSFLD